MLELEDQRLAPLGGRHSHRSAQLDGADRDVAVDHLVGIFRRILDRFWGPRTDDALRAACLTLLRRPDATLADVPSLLSDEAFRRPHRHH